MPRVLYFDPFNGVAGDMILGALIDLGLPLVHLQAEIDRLHLDGVQLVADRLERQGLRGINFQVRLPVEGPVPDKSAHRHSAEDEAHGHHHEHGHAHGHAHDSPADSHSHERNLPEITKLITASGLDPWIQTNALKIFSRLAEAEATVHGRSPDEVHFHEVGAVDAIVDIVGSCVGFRYFGIDHFYTAPLNLGGGTVTFSHGTWPVPAPATAELVRGFPTRLGGIQAELTTPTGAAIVTTLADPTIDIPLMSLSKQGFGAGDRSFPGIPNMLRLLLGETASVASGPSPVEEDQVLLLEAAIDDMDSQSFGYFLDMALKQGALDVYYTPIQMKKNRPAVLLTLLCESTDQDRMVELLFRETTTLGLRYSLARRAILQRETREVRTDAGTIRVKIGRWRGRVVNVQPEYEDLREAAERTGRPLKLVRQDVLKEIAKLSL